MRYCADLLADPAIRRILIIGVDDLAAVTVPITLVRGERGFVTEGDAADFVARVPQASVLTVPSGHNVQEELPVPLAALVFDIADA